MLLEDAPAVLSLGKLCEDHKYSYEWTSGQQHGKLHTDRCPWFIDWLFQLSYTYISSITLRPASIRSESTRSRARWDPSPETDNTNKNEDNETVRRDPLRDLPEWLEEFTENLVDDSVPAFMDAPASSSRESVSERRGKVVSGKHSIFSHFPKNRNCDICVRSKVTRAPCRKNTGAATPRAENVVGFITADHKVLSEGCESRKTSLREQKRAYKRSWSRRGNQKSFTLNIPLNLAKLVNTYLGIIVRRHPDRSETNGIHGGAVRRIEEGTSAVLLQSGLDEKCLADSMECCCNPRNIQDLLSDGKTPYERRFGEPFKGLIIPFGSMVEYHPISAKDLSRLHHFGKKVLPGIFHGYVLQGLGKDGRIRNPCQETQCKGSV